MLIDKQGKIAFKGHPANREDLEADFDALLNGESLAGEGCGAKVEEPDAKADLPKGFKELDMAGVSSEIDTLHAVFEGFTKDEEMIKSAETLQRAFCVLVLEMRYSPKTGSFIGKYDNHRVLQGPKASIDKIKAAFDEKVIGSFEVLSREKNTDPKDTCDEGHKLEYTKASQYGPNMGVYCDSCGKGISGDQMKEGFYVCRQDRADYHRDCVVRDKA